MMQRKINCTQVRITITNTKEVYVLRYILILINLFSVDKKSVKTVLISIIKTIIITALQ